MECEELSTADGSDLHILNELAAILVMQSLLLKAFRLAECFLSFISLCYFSSSSSFLRYSIGFGQRGLWLYPPLNANEKYPFHISKH